ncbi:MAG: hypothetical protein HZC54_05615 [Verrucomicrobia bacterium]|nr:hypothetical protein [Verrucomicrobiota bacterium]
MKRFFLAALLLAPLASLRGGEAEPLLLAHYMPWYTTKEFSGQWGWHWSMGRFDPDRVRVDGRSEAASHDYPLIGLYDSADPHALECQALLMKFAGLDGVVVDWYGTDDFNDYAANHRNTERLIPFIKKAGLRFAICYEDQSIGQMVKAKAIEAERAVARGKQALQWLQKHWFGDDAYVKRDGRPVLFVFGPQYFKGDQWSELRAALSSRPFIYALPHLAKDASADGVFGWPPVAGGKTLAPAEWRQELDRLYARRAAGEFVAAVAFPGYHDIYKEAGLHESYGRIDDREGKTFAETLDLALKSGAPLIQIATWNDYGEGTVIEPTRNHGYRYLEMLQARAQGLRRSPARFRPADLRLPVTLYQLRKRCAGNGEAGRELDKATALLFTSKCGEAGVALKKAAALARAP